jgi:hypothetical protein
MIRFLSAAVTLLTALTLSLTSARAVEDVWDYSVQVSSAVQASPTRITLSWPQDTNGTPSSYTVYRKAPSDSSWGSGTTLSGSTTSYTDTNVTAGTAYEYRIVKAAGSYTGYGYVETGINVPLVENRGKVILLVDNTVASSLSSELARLQQDLNGDGWTVLRHDVGRKDSVTSVKALIQADYNADRGNVKSVFLFGHVPVPYSGQLNPDGHPDHIGAWPADAYYGDMDNDWTDNSVNYVQSLNTDPTDAARITNVPGDGKFDQSDLPSNVELQVGRVDLANMPGRQQWGGPATFPSEIELLRKYLNKDHAFRTRAVNPPRRAILGDYFGARGGEAFAASGFRSFAPLVGANNIRNLNTEFNDQKGVWIPQAGQNDYLLAYACGAGSYDAISGIGNTGLYNSGTTYDMVSANVHGVFNLIFGSWLGDWDHEDNMLRAPLATDYGLVSVWSGRPHWFIHPMGLGETIGYVTQLTQNNVSEYETTINTAAHRIHIALMGDPTLRLHPVVPVAAVNGTVSGSSVALSWGASTDSNLVGYHVYRATSANGPYTRLTSSPVTGTSYTDLAAPGGATYMVRAIKLENTTSGSYYNASQGAFWSAATGSTGGATTGGTVTDTSSSAPTPSAPSTSGSTTTGSTSTSTPSTSGSTSSGSTSTPTSTVVGPTVPSTPTTSVDLSGGTTLWIDDALPTGAGGMGSNGGDNWNWVSSPTPVSGAFAHRSDATAGQHGHWFGWSNSPLIVNQGEVLFTYVYLDPANPPSEIMLSWSTNSSWEHRAYWGADKIALGSGQGHYSAGPLPAAGQWVRLAVPASAVGLDGSIVTAMNFTLFDGGATFDAAGKTLPTAPSIPVTSTPSNPTNSGSTTASLSSQETTWFDDSLPSGAGGIGSNVDTWNWINSNPTPISGTKAHKSDLAAGLHNHWFGWADSTLTIASGDKLFAYVYLDPAHPPTELMIAWSTNSSWDHRAYWGADKIAIGSGAGHYHAGALPPAGQWVRLEVPASAVGLEGQTATAVNFMLNDGSATWDKTGKFTGSLSSTGWTATATASSGGTSSGSTSGTTSTGTTSTSSGNTSGGSSSGSSSTGTTSTSGGSSSGGSTSGTTTTTPTTAANEVTFFDDSLPAGAGGMSGTGGDTWNWVSSPKPISGSLAHVSANAAGQHGHWFGWSNSSMAVSNGDVLYAYVYLDPANTPSEIMLCWSTNASWEHRAYWGANKIDLGSGQGRYYAGALPPTGGWVRLEVPASAVGLAGQSVTAMNFQLFNGSASFDKTGKFSGTAATTGFTVPTGTTSGGTSGGTSGSTTSSTSTSGGTSSGGSTSGTTTTTTPTTAANEVTFFDDTLPAGAGGMAGSGDTWTWTNTPAPISGLNAHVSANTSGQHGHWFGWCNAPMAVNTGDVLYTYVYLDPANPPSEIMLFWSTNSSWEHRAYWGADKIAIGSGAGHYFAGALPPTGGWVRLEVPASKVGLEGQTVTAMNFQLFNGSATFDKTGKFSGTAAMTGFSIPSGSTSTSGGSSSGTSGSGTSTTSTSGGSTSGGSSSGTSTSTTPSTSTSGGSSSGGSSTGSGTATTGGTSIGNPLVSGANSLARVPHIDDYEMRILSPTMIELRRIVTKPSGGAYSAWDFVDAGGNFNAPSTSKFNVTANGQSLGVATVGFRRITAYGQLYVRDFRVEACLYLKLSSPIADNAAVEVKNPDGSLWPSSWKWTGTADALRFNPSIHVNEEGYVPSFGKKAMVGYYLGNLGELPIDSSKGFKLVNAATGVTVYTGTLTHRNETGYEVSPLPYQQVYEADFSNFSTPGQYELVVPGMGASLPFSINDGIAMAFTRTYEMGIYHQRCGGSNDMPYTRFTHAACHTAPAEVPTSDSQYDFTWKTIASYSGGNSRQTAPQITGPSTLLYPFINKGPIDTRGGHHDAGDYSKYTIDVALLAHQLLFTADNIKGAGDLDNLGIPESGDGISDIMQEGKWEADYVAKLQDADGGFYFIVYPKTHEYEADVSPENGAQQVVWPKNTSATAACVGVLAEYASSPAFKKAYPDVAAAYLAKAKLGWQFLTNAIAKYGKDGAYQKITFYGDEFMHDDELAWAAAAMYAATGDAQYQTLLKSWFPNPSDPNTYHWSWQRMYQGWGCAIRDYVFAARSGRLSAGQLDATYLAACEKELTATADDALAWTNGSAYGTSFPNNMKHGMQTGWFFSMETAADMAVAYQINPKQAYLDAVVTNLNYEAGCNPVNASFVAGLGVRRPTQMVGQYRINNRHVLPPDGEPMSNVHSSFGYLPVYGNDLSGASFPADGVTGSSYALQDRYSDIWNVTTEFVTVNQGHALTAAAFLGAMTPAKSTPWKPTNTTASIVAPGSAAVGVPVTLSLSLNGLDVTNARITWEARDQDPAFGSTFTITPKNSGAQWVEAEVQYPDGRRVFINGSFNAQ